MRFNFEHVVEEEVEFTPKQLKKLIKRATDFGSNIKSENCGDFEKILEDSTPVLKLSAGESEVNTGEHTKKSAIIHSYDLGNSKHDNKVLIESYYQFIKDYYNPTYPNEPIVNTKYISSNLQGLLSLYDSKLPDLLFLSKKESFVLNLKSNHFYKVYSTLNRGNLFILKCLGNADYYSHSIHKDDFINVPTETLIGPDFEMYGLEDKFDIYYTDYVELCESVKMNQEVYWKLENLIREYEKIPLKDRSIHLEYDNGYYAAEAIRMLLREYKLLRYGY